MPGMGAIMSRISPRCGREWVGNRHKFIYYMKDLSWKTLSREYLFKENWLTLRKDTCETNEGKLISPYYVYEFPDWVIAVALTEDGRFILERQYRQAIGRMDYELPGGCVDPTDRTLEDAL